jgi:cytochrome P450
MEKYGTDQLTFDAYDDLPKTRAALVEALRMYPAGNVLIRESTEDCVLQVPYTSEDGSRTEKSMHVPKGTVVVGDMIGMR